MREFIFNHAKTWRGTFLILIIHFFLPFVCIASADHEYCKIQEELTDFRSHLRSIAKILPQKIQDRIQKQRLASISLAVIHDQDLIFCNAFGYADIEKKIQATKETICPIASVTKVFTATMLMQLCEQNIVKLEMPIKELVSEYQVANPYPGTQDATLRLLASHTSGLPQDAPPNFGVTIPVSGGS
jgi:CubicO group peptidase (beta-lactamase class C family)